MPVERREGASFAKPPLPRVTIDPHRAAKALARPIGVPTPQEQPPPLDQRFRIPGIQSGCPSELLLCDSEEVLRVVRVGLTDSPIRQRVRPGSQHANAVGDRGSGPLVLAELTFVVTTERQYFRQGQ